MKRQGNLLLIIDAQNDFCHPKGALSVPGADRDMFRLARFIEKKGNKIDEVILTQDHHHVLDIAHPGFWRNQRGETPDPFTTISLEMVEREEWLPIFQIEKVKNYLTELKQQDVFPHVIWPEHCLIGSWGAAVYDEVFQAVRQWTYFGKYYQLIPKGQNPLTEHFGALRANIPIASDVSTCLNAELASRLKRANRVLVAGEAKSHCVASSVKQILDLKGFKSELILLTDCMSAVPGFEEQGKEIFLQASAYGAKLMPSSEVL